MKTFKYVSITMMSTYYLVPERLYTTEAKEALALVAEGSLGGTLELNFKQVEALKAVLYDPEVIGIR